MNSILDRVAEANRPFFPRTPSQFLALQIARKLNALPNARDYAILLEHYPEKLIAKAFHACIAHGDPSHEAFLRAFRSTIHQPDL